MSTRVTLVNGTGTELGTAVDPLNVEGTLTTTISTIDTVTNLVQQGGIAISLNTGVRDTGTQRVTIATDDVVPVTFTGSTDVATQTTLASALTSLQTLDNAISGAGFNITQIGGAAAPIGAGLEATAVRVTLPTDVTGVVKLGAWTAEIGKLAAGLANIGDVDVLTIAAGDNNIGNVDIASIAAGDNNIGNVDIVSGTITTVSTVTSVTAIANALPAGTNAIGKLLPPDIDVTTNTNYAKKYYTNAGAVTDGIIWSPAAGKRWHVHTIYINVSAAATVTLEDDLAAGDSAIWKGEFAA